MTVSERTASEVLDIPLYRLGMTAALRACAERVASGEGGYACFVNAHSITEAAQESRIGTALRGGTFAFPDGLPLVWASHLKRNPIRGRVCGPDFMTELLRANPAETFGFIGGKPGQAEKIAVRFGVRAISYSPPFRPFSEENAREDWHSFTKISETVNGKLPRIVWVCLGAPKQELWMNVVSPIAPGVFFHGVGAAIDFLAQEKKRAPVWMQKAGLEWFFRLIQEPGRLWRRYLVTNTLFVTRVFMDLFRGGRRI